MEEFKPKLTTSGFGDFMAFFAVGAFQAAVMFVLPGYLTYTATGSEVSGWGVGIVLYGIFLLFSVSSVGISESGIHLKRVFGTPKEVPWGRVRGFIEANPREVIVLGWLWPLFPAREMTPCMSCKGHIRIQLDDGYFYYPPKAMSHFIDALEKYGAKRL
jgi:hypothetical protein